MVQHSVQTSHPTAAKEPQDGRSTTGAAQPGSDALGIETGATRVPRGTELLGAGFSTNRELLQRGQRAFARGDDACAFENLTRLTERGNLYADVHYMIGILYERRDERQEAIESLRRAVRTNPSYVEALLALASLHEHDGDFDRSAGYAERASQLTRSESGQLDPTTRGKLSNQQAALADTLFEAGERRDAIEQYRRALERCPDFHDIRHRLGVALREAGLPFQAAQEFSRILNVQTTMLESQVQLGVTYYSLGRTPEAIEQWETVLERDPSRDEARMYLRLVNRNQSDHEQSSLAPKTFDAGGSSPLASRTSSGWSTRAIEPASGNTSVPSPSSPLRSGSDEFSIAPSGLSDLLSDNFQDDQEAG